MRDFAVVHGVLVELAVNYEPSEREEDSQKVELEISECGTIEESIERLIQRFRDRK